MKQGEVAGHKAGMMQMLTRDASEVSRQSLLGGCLSLS